MPNLFPQYAAWRSVRRSNIPFVFSPHGGLEPYVRSSGGIHKRLNDAVWQHRMIRDASAIHAGTIGERGPLLDLKLNSNVVVIPIGVDATMFTPPQPGGEQTLNQIPRQYRIVSHGRLDPVKGYDQLLRALARLRSGGVNARVQLIGPDYQDYGAELRRISHELGISDFLDFRGDLNGQALVAALREADVWVSASHIESFGMAVVEALALGLPVVASDRVRIAEEASASGAVLLTRNTPEGLAYAISRVLSHQDQAQKLTSAGLEFAKRLDWTTVVVQFEQLYVELTERE